MNLRDLKYLVAVADFQHFGKAAEHCFVSQPTLSGQIKKLEQPLGVTLFERTNRRVMLTQVGQSIIEAARRTLQAAQDIEDIAHNAQSPLAGKFRLGAFPTLAPYLFPQLVPKIKENLPNLRLILQEEKTAILIENLKSGLLYAAFLALPIHEDSLQATELFDDAFMLAVSPEHELAQYKAIHQSVLGHYHLLLLEEVHCLRDQALDLCQLYSAPEEQDFRATSLETLRQMVKAGTGITFMPQIAISEHEKDIHYIPFKEPAPNRSIALVYRKTSCKTAVIEALRALFKK